FTGLPSPAAAALVAGMLWVLSEYGVDGSDATWWAAALTIYAGLTMVSNVRFYSGKDINLRRSVPFSFAVVIVLALLLISLEPPVVLWGLTLAYGVSGYFGWAVQRWRQGAVEKKHGHIREAIEEGNVGGLARMLAHTPADTVISSDGLTLLMMAVEESNLPAVELLVARGATLDMRDQSGATALTLAAEMGFQEAVEVLLGAKANPNVQDVSGMTPLDIAEEHGAQDVAALLLRFGAKSGRELGPAQP
ncbi:MAG TPA: ankyrin repeat domain-containing protein, partial [Usitatibacter sp.]|nr:ankyrin repeat domain-containing protein [Usitatibacter sp.]